MKEKEKVAGIEGARAEAPRWCGPLHGIPVLLKDNIATRDRTQTTAGSLALVGSVPPKDAFVAKKLCNAGAVDAERTSDVNKVGATLLFAMTRDRPEGREDLVAA